MARSDKRRGRGRIALGALIALAPVGVACNGIIGLSDFDKGQCSGARCADEGGFPDQIVIDGGPDVVQDASIDVIGSSPVSWAKWPMPNYLVDGGPTSKPPQSPPLSVDPGAGVVSDLTTKLVWRSTVTRDLTAREAEAECKKLADGPWRAPKRIELVSLLDYSRPSTPFIDTVRFADLGYRVWSTSEVRSSTGPASQAYWTVNFDTGSVEPRAGDLKAKVLCLRAVTK